MDTLKDVIRYIEEDIPFVVYAKEDGIHSHLVGISELDILEILITVLYEKGSDDPLLGAIIKMMLEEAMDEF